jgi:UDP-N-acetylmuramoyl-tripeptide--D-alanyl-D-alanine ligase
VLELRASEIAAAVSGRLIGPDVMVRDVVIDSRRARRASLFFALRGTRTDGHRFVEDAVARGASGAVVSHDGPSAPAAFVLVPEPATALLDLARHHRRRLRGTAVAVTGSVGKTTTKDLVAAVLGRFRVAASPRSFNNEIGVPLTLLGADPRTEVLVAELGAGAVGEIAALCELVRPHIGIVTAVGPAHLETFGSLDNVARAKAELVEAVPSDGLAILNVDDPVVASFEHRSAAPVLSYGRGARATVRAHHVRVDHHGRPSFTATYGRSGVVVELPMVGEHMITPALAAIACGVALGVPIECAADALRTAETSPGRMRELRISDGVRVIDDAYNANPMSMAAGLRAAVAARGDSAAIAVLGAMEQLGSISRREHVRIGRAAVALGFEHLIAVGEDARPILEGALAAGIPRRRARWVAAPTQAAEEVRSVARPGDVVLVKGSRAARLERVVEALCGA